MSISADKLASLIERFKNSDRSALAKIITIIESTAAHDRPAQEHILNELIPGRKDTMRLAISGPPGVGKSTFINMLGQKLVERAMTVAILPIDPSSDVSMGSILADKTRMKELIASDQVYIRPSPSKGHLGGVGLSTEDVIFLMEAFGFDCVIIETVGVGQSETIAQSLCDHFVLLMQPGSGDQLQAMKMGILEKADFILINKADHEQKALAEKTKSSLKALSLRQASVKEPFVATMSALADSGIDDFLDELLRCHQDLLASGFLTTNRQKNRARLCDYLFSTILMERLEHLESIKKLRQQILEKERPDHPLSPALNRLVDEICRRLV